MNKDIENFRKKSSEADSVGPVHLKEDGETGDLLLIYNTPGGPNVEFKYSRDSLWMTQAQIAELFGRDQSVISRHISGIFEDEELERDRNMHKMHKSTKPVTLYSLDLIISVGYRVSSKQATMFRRWATDKLVQFATKGFVIDDIRLKNPADYNHFKELREKIRDIRASEANVYREIKTICTMCSDYDGSSKEARNLFAGVQNKLLWASCTMTAPEIIHSRANANLDHMGLTNWPKQGIRKSDVTIAHNYLSEPEIKTKNLLTNMLLDYFESRLDQGKLTTLTQVDQELVRFLKFNEYPVLQGLGSIKRTAADKHAHLEYQAFDEKRRALRQENP